MSILYKKSVKLNPAVHVVALFVRILHAVITQIQSPDIESASESPETTATVDFGSEILQCLCMCKIHGCMCVCINCVYLFIVFFFECVGVLPFDGEIKMCIYKNTEQVTNLATVCVYVGVGRNFNQFNPF